MNTIKNPESSPSLYKKAWGAWACLGLTLFMLSFFIAPSTNSHKTVFYFMVLLPCLIGFKWILREIKLAEPVFFMALMLVAYLALAIFWSNDYSTEALIKTVQRAIYMSALICIVLYVTKTQKAFHEDLILLLLLTSSFIGIYLIYDFYSNYNWNFNKTFIPEWRYRTQNRMAKVYGTISLISAATIFITNRPWKKYLSGTSLIIALTVLLLTRCKGATYAIIITMPLILFLHSNKPKKFNYLPIVILVLAGIAFNYRVILEQIELHYINDGWSDRDIIWKTILKEHLDSFFFGQGRLIDASIVSDSGFTYGHEHNMFLALLRQSGIIGLIFSLVIIGLIIIKSIKSADVYLRLWSILLIYGSIATISGGKYPLQRPTEDWLLFWIPIAFTAALISHSKKVDAET